MRSRNTIIVGVMLLSFFVVGLAFLGGWHHQTFTRYTTFSQVTGSSESDFKLAIYPEFTSGGSSGVETYIPYLFHGQRETCSDAHIILNLTPHSDAYGYGGKQSVSLTSVTIKNTRGDTFPLITPGSVRTFGLVDTGFGSRREDLGPVDGDHLTISAEGSVLTNASETRRFTFQQSWSKTHSTRSGLGITFGE